MGMFSQYTKEGHGISKEQANAPAFIQFFRILGTRFWSLIFLNLIYILFLSPGLISIGGSLFVYYNYRNIIILLGMILVGVLYLGIIGGPATAGMVKILRNWSRREAAFIWGDFWETFKKNFKLAALVGGLNSLITSILLFNLYFYYINANTETPIPALYFWVVVLTFIVFLFMNYYMFTMLVTFKLSVKQLYKNAFIFAFAGIIRNIGITAIIAAVCCLFILFHSSPLVWVIYFCCFLGFIWYVITFITYPLIKKTMIDGIDPDTGKRIEQQCDKED